MEHAFKTLISTGNPEVFFKAFHVPFVAFLVYCRRMRPTGRGAGGLCKNLFRLICSYFRRAQATEMVYLMTNRIPRWKSMSARVFAAAFPSFRHYRNVSIFGLPGKESCWWCLRRTDWPHLISFPPNLWTSPKHNIKACRDCLIRSLDLRLLDGHGFAERWKLGRRLVLHAAFYRQALGNKLYVIRMQHPILRSKAVYCKFVRSQDMSRVPENTQTECKGPRKVSRQAKNE